MQTPGPDITTRSPRRADSIVFSPCIYKCRETGRLNTSYILYNQPEKLLTIAAYMPDLFHTIDLHLRDFPPAPQDTQ